MQNIIRINIDLIPGNRIGLLGTKKTLGSWWISIQDEEIKELMSPQLYSFCYIIYNSAVKKTLFYGNFDCSIKILYHWFLLCAHAWVKNRKAFIVGGTNLQKQLGCDLLRITKFIFLIYKKTKDRKRLYVTLSNASYLGMEGFQKNIYLLTEEETKSALTLSEIAQLRKGQRFQKGVTFSQDMTDYDVRNLLESLFPDILPNKR